MDVGVGAGEGEHEEGGGHEEGAPHHWVESCFGVLSVPSGFRVDLFVDGYKASGEEDTELDREKLSQTLSSSERKGNFTIMLTNAIPVRPSLQPRISANAIGNAKNIRSK